MSKVNFPHVGDIHFFMNKAVVIKEVIKEFHIVKISYVNSNTDFYTDVTALTIQPNLEINSLDIRMFVKNEQ